MTKTTGASSRRDPSRAWCEPSGAPCAPWRSTARRCDSDCEVALVTGPEGGSWDAFDLHAHRSASHTKIPSGSGVHAGILTYDSSSERIMASDESPKCRNA